jgi:threonine/homoserine/homoserine lactone efflux protein
MDQGRAAGLVSVLGIHTGSIVHVAAAALGLSAILASSALAFGVVKYAGAAYLIWLGIRTIRERGEERPGVIGRAHSLRRIYAQGVVVNVLNPKTALFFLAFLPQFVDVSEGSVPLQAVILGATFIALGFIGRHVRAGLRPRLACARRPASDRCRAPVAPGSDADRARRGLRGHGPPPCRDLSTVGGTG